MNIQNSLADHFLLRIGISLTGLCLSAFGFMNSTKAAEPVNFGSVAAIFKERCVKCHGPAKAEARLDLSTAASLVRGGESGPIIAPHQIDESILWERIKANEMPPKQPLTSEEKEQIKAWILAGAPGLPSPSLKGDGDHWAFKKLAVIVPPSVKNQKPIRNQIDRFIESALERDGQEISQEAPRQRLIRRVSLTLTGLPPSPESVKAFISDTAPNAYQSMVEQFLASPQYGERWGKYWLDAVGYADSNGYFNADSDRPLAYRYRDYVIKAMNKDMPLDRFLREQIAGDEISGFTPGQTVTTEVADRLIATHFLRNGQDGSGESDGNPDEVRVDRYTALESSQQIIASSLLGLTMQCAKCHSHKFEPITHEDYYQFQAILSPVFPAATDSLWIKPQARFVLAPTSDQKREFERNIKELDEKVAKLQSRFSTWVSGNRPKGEVLFKDDFDQGIALTPRWSNVAPSDNQPGGSPPVTVDANKAPSARQLGGRLEIIAGITSDSWLTTEQSFDWTPDKLGEAIQVTFDLVDTRLNDQAKRAERVGYFISTHDFNDDGKLSGGNILVDGHPSTGTSVIVDYPGKDSNPKGAIGRTGYVAGKNYGVRVTNIGNSQFRLEQLIDGFPEEPHLTLSKEDLPSGGFGFEYHSDRSFVVDHVMIERFGETNAKDRNSIAIRNEEFRRRQKELDLLKNQASGLKNNPPFKISWATDVNSSPPETHLLIRGDYAKPGAVMAASPISALSANKTPFQTTKPVGARTTGRRLALANGLTDPNERASSLLARVQVNRIWQSYFGTGIVSTPENLGLSGSPPSHPELLDWLAGELIQAGWSLKHVHRLILNSGVFRQSSDTTVTSTNDNRLLGRFPAVRLDAETIRDSMLYVSGELDSSMGGPYVPIQANADGAVVISESDQGGRRRSVYLQQRRTQVVSLLQVFDAPTIVFNSLRRPRTAMPLQSLALMNSDFVRARAQSFAGHILDQKLDEPSRIRLAFMKAYSRTISEDEEISASQFIKNQEQLYAPSSEARSKAWIDFCQSLLMSNEFLYLD